ncbi:hypothetical protein [Paenibacillus sp. UNC451MF]|uniref:hypothetical protein n=1 Tax=Paenibacillus sp. UNC451MF TaxID=1449063 RepID=UPI00048DB39F|nr:hypothetical protein [Paenibacillus sp. UNC451MF]
MDSSSIISIIERLSLGQTIRVFFDNTSVTGKFQGLKGCTIQVVSSVGNSFYIPVQNILSIVL